MSEANVSSSSILDDPFKETFDDPAVLAFFAVAWFLVQGPGNYMLFVLISSIRNDPLVMLTDRLLCIIYSLTIVFNGLSFINGEQRSVSY